MNPRPDPRPDTRSTPPRRKAPSRLPIRGAIGAGVTAAGLAMLLSVRAPVAAGVDTALLTGTTDKGRTTGSVGLAIATATPGGTTSTGTTATATTGAQPTASATATATPAQSVVLTGDAVSMRFGTVQVQVTVENGVITNVAALQLPDGDRHSLQISQAVEPMLADEVLTAQSASIDTVSGATYTSRAYQQSLQSAIDQLAA